MTHTPSPLTVTNMTADVLYFIGNAESALQDMQPKTKRDQQHHRQATAALQRARKQLETLNGMACDTVTRFLEEMNE